MKLSEKSVNVGNSVKKEKIRRSNWKNKKTKRTLCYAKCVTENNISRNIDWRDYQKRGMFDIAKEMVNTNRDIIWI